MPRAIGQASIDDIFPGITTESDLLGNVGKPVRIYEKNIAGITIWEYPDYFLDIENHVVKRIHLTESLFLSLAGYLEEFGCPQGIYELLASEDSGVSALILIFPKAGVSLEFTHLNVRGDEYPLEVFFFEPVSLSNLLEMNATLREFARPIKWSQAYEK